MAVRRHGLTFPFHFFVHDGESSVRAPEWVDNRANSVNLTSPNRAQFAFSNPEWMHEEEKQNEALTPNDPGNIVIHYSVKNDDEIKKE